MRAINALQHVYGYLHYKNVICTCIVFVYSLSSIETCTSSITKRALPTGTFNVTSVPTLAGCLRPCCCAVIIMT